MFVSFLPLWQILDRADEGEFGLRSNEPPDGPIIGFAPLLASAYDMHTRDGRIALRRFAALTPIAAALAPIPSPKDRMSALYAALFTVEGGKLNLRVSLPEIDRLHFHAIHVELEYFGLKEMVNRCALLSAVQRHLWSLHQLRSHAVKIAGRAGAIGNAENQGLTAAPTSGHTHLPGQLALGFQEGPIASHRRVPAPSPDFDPASTGIPLE